MEIYYVVLSLYDRKGNLMDDVADCVVRGSSPFEAVEKSEKLTLSNYSAASCEWNEITVIDQLTAEDLACRYPDVIVEPALCGEVNLPDGYVQLNLFKGDWKDV